MDNENNGMHVNPITNDAWKDWSVKKLKSENFLVSIDRTSIKYRSREAESFEHKNSQFWSVEGDLWSVKAVTNFKT